MHHSIWKIPFVLQANKYLERLGDKIRKSAYSFMLNYSKITVWPFMPVADVSKDPVVNQWLSSNDLIAHRACKDSPE